MLLSAFVYAFLIRTLFTVGPLRDIYKGLIHCIDQIWINNSSFFFYYASLLKSKICAHVAESGTNGEKMMHVLNDRGYNSLHNRPGIFYITVMGICKGFDHL